MYCAPCDPRASAGFVPYPASVGISSGPPAALRTSMLRSPAAHDLPSMFHVEHKLLILSIFASFSTTLTAMLLAMLLAMLSTMPFAVSLALKHRVEVRA